MPHESDPCRSPGGLLGRGSTNAHEAASRDRQVLAENGDSWLQR